MYLYEFATAQRPGDEAVCTSLLSPGVEVDITRYDDSGSSRVSTTTFDLPISIYADAFDGFAVHPLAAFTSAPPSSTTSFLDGLAAQTSQTSTPAIPGSAESSTATIPSMTITSNSSAHTAASLGSSLIQPPFRVGVMASYFVVMMLYASI